MSQMRHFGGRMKKEVTMATLRKFHLWSALPDELWQTLADRMEWRDYSVGETVFPCDETEKCLCVLWNGRARVYSKSSTPTHTFLLRTMEAGAIFGVHAIFNSDISPQSYIIADRPCRVLLIRAELWETMLISHAPTMAHYISFLTKRIEFLNRKVQYLTAGSAERRLSLYLLSQIDADGVPTRLDVSAVSLADLLDLGRASLYRALDKLTSDGFLSRDGHTYMLHNREALLTHYS